MNQMFWFLKFTQLSGTISGLLAAAIENMDGIGGKPGWAWIFILVCLRLLPSVKTLNHFYLGRNVFYSRR